MESQAHAARPRSTNEHLVGIADELLEHTRALRRQHEELRDRLAGITVVAPEEPLPAAGAVDGPERLANGGPPNGFYPMVLQMALAGETREFALDQLRALEVDGADELVEEVFERVESQRTEGRRRLFGRRD
jgi:hypothetical protein